jgi:hypothetical protein
MRCNLPNRKSGSKTPEEEAALRQDTANKMAKVMKVIYRLLKPLVRDLPDPRNQDYVRYPKESLFLYGVMMFSMKATSRRNANRFMTEPFMQANLRAVIPGLESVAHGDTLADYLELIDPETIQRIYHVLIKKLLRNKEFRRLVGKKFTVLVDGSGKESRDWEYSDKALHRKTQNGEIYLTYVLSAVLVLENGMVIPLCTEFLENIGEAFDKQDCETKAWHRMAPKLHRLVGNGATLVMDGLYASGPIIMQCREYGWDYVITLKDGSMPSFSEEAHAIMGCDPSNSLAAEADGRRQEISWANGVEHTISKNNTRINLNVIRMVETWTERHPVTGKESEPKTVTYQWITSFPLDKTNAQQVCRLGRGRWLIENSFKTEKHSGYGFEHFFSYDWDVNKAYHYFMNFGHFINVMLMSSEDLSDLVSALGIGGFLDKMRLVFSGFVLDADSIRDAVAQPFRWRLNPASIYHRAVSPP